jgi:hypothetical protein
MGGRIFLPIFLPIRGAFMADRERQIAELGRLMSDCSEDCYCAGWLGNTEYLVPELCRRALETDEPQPWGHGEVTPQLAAKMTALAKEMGHWAVLDELGVGYELFDPFPIPPEILEELDREKPRRSGG